MASSRLSGRAILVVEDEAFLRLDLADTLHAVGARVVCAAAASEALSALASTQLSAAVLDVRLRDGDCAPVCQSLRERNVPFLFYTGCQDVPDGYAGVPIIAKPAPLARLIEALEALCQGPSELQTSRLQQS